MIFESSSILWWVSSPWTIKHCPTGPFAVIMMDWKKIMLQIFKYGVSPVYPAMGPLMSWVLAGRGYGVGSAGPHIGEDLGNVIMKLVRG